MASFLKFLSALVLLLPLLSNANQPKVYSDANLQLPAAWKKCSQDNQCVQIPNGCWFASVNSKYEKEATVWSIKKAGDPRTLNCYYPRMKKPLMAPACLENKCTIVGEE